MTVTITGTYGGGGSISGYTSGTVYYINQTNGTTNFRLGTYPAANYATGVTTTAGTPTGLTYTVSSNLYILGVLSAAQILVAPLPSGLPLSALTTASGTMTVTAGDIFGGLTSGTTYYVVSKNSNDITLSTSPTLSPVLTTSVMNGAWTYLAGSVLGGLTSGTTYYIASIASNQVTLSTSATLSPVVTLTNGASGTSPWTSLAGSVFGGLTSGSTYYVASIASNQVTLSTSATLSPVVTLTNGAGAWTGLAGNTFGGITAATTYYIASISGSQITISTSQTLTPVVSVTTGAGAWTTSSGPVTSFPIGSYITVSGLIPAGYNGNFLVTGSTASSVSYASVQTGTLTVLGTVSQASLQGNTTVTLIYNTDPGLYGTGTTLLTIPSTGIDQPYSTLGASTFRIGYARGATAQITTKISTTRATGHDFLDVGTGGYNTTNYPYQIYGNPTQSKTGTAGEVNEEGVGRCFYVTTDQDGIFRVGRFFTVDQGTGNVTFSAAISLSNLDGIGFKRGVVVSEFSTDNTFTNNASDTVPVQSAVRGYIDKRLGLDHGGSIVSSSNLVGPGYLPLNGNLGMKASMNLAGFTIQNVGNPINNSDAANKNYVDQQIQLHDQLAELSDIEIVTPTLGQLFVYNTTGSKWNNATLAGDITVSYNGSTKALTSAIGSGKIVNSQISTTAAVAQSKLNLNSASTTSSAPTPAATVAGSFIVGQRYRIAALGNTTQLQWNTTAGTSGITYAVNSTFTASTVGTGTGTAVNLDTIQAANGVASFDSTNFNATDGWISIKSGSITRAQLASIGTGSVLGNFSGSASVPQEITPLTVLNNGLDAKLTTTSGLLTYTGSLGGLSTTGLTTTGAANSIVKTDANGAIDVQALKIDGYSIIDTASTTVQFTTPGSSTNVWLSAVGTQASNTVITVSGTLDNSSGTTKTTTITSGGPGLSGSITGQWQFTASSELDMSISTLKSRSLTTGAAGVTGTITGNWGLSAGSQLSATYADLAEYYSSDQEYEPGTVLIFGGEFEVTRTNIFGDSRAAGVVTTNPAYILNSELQGTKVCIALQGRVPVKVVGKVSKGDLITTAGVPGYGCKAIDPKIGTIIGKAIEDKVDPGMGIVEVAIGRM
jgi:hypothetical protein